MQRKWILALFFLAGISSISGFVAMDYEVVWARLISLHTVGAVYSFSVMLTVFLAGLVVGGLLGAWMVRKGAQPCLLSAVCSWPSASWGGSP